jgi:hypothetical protein
MPKTGPAPEKRSIFVFIELRQFGLGDKWGS